MMKFWKSWMHELWSMVFIKFGRNHGQSTAFIKFWTTVPLAVNHLPVTPSPAVTTYLLRPTVCLWRGKSLLKPYSTETRQTFDNEQINNGSCTKASYTATHSGTSHSQGSYESAVPVLLHCHSAQTELTSANILSFGSSPPAVLSVWQSPNRIRCLKTAKRYTDNFSTR